jgi:dipeptidase E
MKGLFAGSGSDALNNPTVCKRVLELVGKACSEITLLYLGTATYDSTSAKVRQTSWFNDQGVRITEIKCATNQPTKEEMESKTSEADIVLVSGGNTLFAVDRWKNIGLGALLETSMNQGSVLCGGSAGAICWFDGGHSDSMDPDSYQPKYREEHLTQESSWEYVRVGCLGFLPGLACPHYDKVQSNGVLRATDFQEMVSRHPTERGICIDHWAALVVDGEAYSVFTVDGKPGSVMDDETFSETQQGKPGIWIKDAGSGGKAIKTTLAPSQGLLKDLLRQPTGGSTTEDPRLSLARKENPQPQE